MRHGSLIWSLIFLGLLTSPAYAYLDPGTGSILLQALIGGIAASVTLVSLYYQKAKALLASIFSSKQGAGKKAD